MTLGEIIKNYCDEHSITQFIKDSGISKAYVYMLIANKNNKGEPITPSIETIKKVAVGMHKSFDEIFNQLDYDFIVHLGSAYRDHDTLYIEPTDENTYYQNRETAQLAQELFEDSNMRLLFDAAKDSRPEDLRMAADLLKRLKETNPDG